MTLQRWLIIAAFIFVLGAITAFEIGGMRAVAALPFVLFGVASFLFIPSAIFVISSWDTFNRKTPTL